MSLDAVSESLPLAADADDHVETSSTGVTCLVSKDQSGRPDKSKPSSSGFFKREKGHGETVARAPSVVHDGCDVTPRVI